MNIKKSIVGPLFSMLLVSEMAAADWGDVYYCQMTELVKITRDGEMTKHTLNKFQFKLDQTKNAMVFGQEGFFGNSEAELRKGWDFPSQENWCADSEYAGVYFEKGKFLYSRTGPSGVTAISADCDKF